MVNNLPANAINAGSFPGLGTSPGVGNGNLFHILAWEIPWTEKPGRLQSMSCKRIRNDLGVNKQQLQPEWNFHYQVLLNRSCTVKLNGN